MTKVKNSFDEIDRVLLRPCSCCFNGLCYWPQRLNIGEQKRLLYTPSLKI